MFLLFLLFRFNLYDTRRWLGLRITVSIRPPSWVPASASFNQFENRRKIWRQKRFFSSHLECKSSKNLPGLLRLYILYPCNVREIVLGYFCCVQYYVVSWSNLIFCCNVLLAFLGVYPVTVQCPWYHLRGISAQLCCDQYYVISWDDRIFLNCNTLLDFLGLCIL